MTLMGRREGLWPVLAFTSPLNPTTGTLAELDAVWATAHVAPSARRPGIDTRIVLELFYLRHAR